MSVHGTTPDAGELRYWENPEYREKYSDADREAMAKKGHAMPDGSYPIADEEDLHNAIHAVGRGGSDHDAIRKHIIARAADLGHSDAIPDNWNADGSLKQSNSRRKGRWTNQRRRVRDATTALTPKQEVRIFNVTGLELRDAGGSGDTVSIVGMPIVYNTPYTVMDFWGEFEERMAPGVATDVMSSDVRFLIDHDPSRLVARTASGTMRMTDSPEGLRIAADIDLRDTDANNLAVRLERGDISQMSCGFIVGYDGDDWNDAEDQRVINRFQELFDVSAVTYPASPSTVVEIQQRMASRLTIQTEVRARRLYTELRAGKKLSAAHEGMLTDAVSTLHGLMDSAGVPIPGGGLSDDNPDGQADDGAESGILTGADMGDTDGLTGEPLNDPGEQIHVSDQLLAGVRARRGVHHGARHAGESDDNDLVARARRLVGQ